MPLPVCWARWARATHLPTGARVVVEHGATLAVDVPSSWARAYNAKLAAFADADPSVAALRAARRAPLDLGRCLAAGVFSPEVVTAYSPALTAARGEYSETEQRRTPDLFRPPRVLVLVLKRFEVGGEQNTHGARAAAAAAAAAE